MPNISNRHFVDRKTILSSGRVRFNFYCQVSMC